MIDYKKPLKASAQALRREMTPEEKRLWYDFLKKLPITVNRQKIIGCFIVDFYIASKKLVIEVDGRQHFTTEHAESDRARDGELSSRGIRVFRCTNEEIKTNFKQVCDRILDAIGLRASEIPRS